MFTARKHRDSESSPYRQIQQHAQNIIKTGERLKAYAAQMDSIRSGSASVSATGEAPVAKPDAENGSASVSATGEAPGAKPDAENGSASVSATGKAPVTKPDAENGSAKGGRHD